MRRTLEDVPVAYCANCGRELSEAERTFGVSRCSSCAEVREQPEQAALALIPTEYAGFGSRAGAYALDYLFGGVVAAGLGFDARLMAETSSSLKSRMGVMAYFVTALRLLPSLPAVRTEIEVDGRHHELNSVVVFVANCGQILPGLVGPRAPLDPFDGLLDVVVVHSSPSPAGSGRASKFHCALSLTASTLPAYRWYIASASPSVAIRSRSACSFALSFFAACSSPRMASSASRW